MELQTLAKIGTGFPWSSNFFIEDQSQQGEPFIRIRNCRPVAIEVDELDKLDPNYANAQGQGKALYGDLVVGMDGLKWFLAGLVTGPCYINQRVAHIKQVPGSVVSPEFLLVCINSLIGQKQLLRVMTIAQTVGHITLNDIRSLLIPQLPASVHDRISEAVKGSCAARKESKTLLNASKRAVEIAIEEGEAAARNFLHQEDHISG